MQNTYRQIGSIFTLLFSLCFAACRPADDGLSEYHFQMESFFEQLSHLGDSLDALDPEAPESAALMLHYLDEIAVLVHDMASYEVPDFFPGVADLAEQADLHMMDAVSLYHEAYEAPVFNENIADAAYEYYERANLRLHYIADILRGDIPEDIFEVPDEEWDTIF